MKVFKTLATSGSALTAEKLRLDTIANNLANMNTTRTAEGGPYRRQVPIFIERLQRVGVQPGERPPVEIRSRARHNWESTGVRVLAIPQDPNPPRIVYDPEHPDADEEGYVEYPNVDMVREMVDMITATRSYEANVTVLNATKNMLLKSLEIGRG